VEHCKTCGNNTIDNKKIDYIKLEQELEKYKIIVQEREKYNKEKINSIIQ
jgi:hypothetical protein